jgi:acyl carrier protein
MEKEDIRTKIKHFLAEKSPLVANEKFDDHLDLFSCGILDSLAFLELVSFIENEFSIDLVKEIPVNNETLSSIHNITEVVSSAQKNQK